MGFKMNDSILYEYVLEEFEAQRITKSLWAKAIAHSGGNSDKTQSLYLQYRVDDLKQEFNTFAIDYSDLTLTDLSHYVDNLFVDDEWRKSKIADKEKHEEDLKNKLAQEEQEKKYGKIGGWLFPFAIFLGLWLIGAAIQSVYTRTTVLNDVEFWLLEGHAELVSAAEQEFLLQLASLFIISWFSLVFYKKRKSAKDGAIVFFIAAFIMHAMYSYIVLSYFGEILDLLPAKYIAQAVIVPVWVFFISLISIIYFIKSERVKKTFVKEGADGEWLLHGFLSILLPVVLLISYYNVKPDSYKLARESIQQAELAFKNNDLDRAGDFYKKAKNLGIDKQDDFSKKLFELASIQFDKKNYFSADTLFEKAGSHRSDFYFQAAEKYFEEKMYSQSAFWYQKALDAGITKAQFRLAYSYNEIKEFDLAIKHYIEENERNPWIGTMSNLSRVFMLGKKNYHKTIEWAKKAYDLDPKYGAFELGYAYDELGNYAESAKWYEKAIETHPEEPIAYWNLGLAYAKQPSLGREDFRNKKSFDLFLKAARLGYRNAYEEVAYRYRNGIGTNVDLEKARFWENK